MSILRGYGLKSVLKIFNLNPRNETWFINAFSDTGNPFRFIAGEFIRSGMELIDAY
jgi:hypothetical protein